MMAVKQQHAQLTDIANAFTAIDHSRQGAAFDKEQLSEFFA